MQFSVVPAGDVCRDTAPLSDGQYTWNRPFAAARLMGCCKQWLRSLPLGMAEVVSTVGAARWRAVAARCERQERCCEQRHTRGAQSNAAGGPSVPLQPSQPSHPLPLLSVAGPSLTDYSLPERCERARTAVERASCLPARTPRQITLPVPVRPASPALSAPGISRAGYSSPQSVPPTAQSPAEHMWSVSVSGP